MLSKSKKINDGLAKINVQTMTDVINYLPTRYLDLSPTKENDLLHKEKVVIYGKVVSSPTLQKVKRLAIVTFYLLTAQGNCFKVVAFNRPYLTSFLKLNQYFTVYATYDRGKKCLNLINVYQGKIADEETIRPLYPLPNEIENYVFARLVKKGLASNLEIQDFIPGSLEKKYQLPNKRDVLSLAHFPKNLDDVFQSQRYLKYEECLLFAVKTMLIRQKNKLLEKGQKKDIPLKKINEFIQGLPYKLTSDQVQAVREIVLDMNEQNLMYRLLQGDVGTGKTLVAALALYANYLRGDIGALMAPTDTLARQHYQTLKTLFKDVPISLSLLVGATTLNDKKEIKKGLKEGKISIIVGTHALFSDDVHYQSLGLVIIDEQHRFGVNQRMLLTSKGEKADLLLMSATPIPRSLALSIYGDLDVTTISQFPFQKRNVLTEIIRSDDKLIYQEIEAALSKQKCIYLIAPLIEILDEEDCESVESLYHRFAKLFPQKVALLHGKMSPSDKDEVLQNFLTQKTPILVATSVIEVGIDVQEASLMIIFGAHHFGLAALHQLRGRIGRDGTKAKCFLVCDEEDEDKIDKLSVLVKNDDGFVIAEEDLKRRGPGELTGYKQSGLPNFQFVNLINDFKIFTAARKDAIYILDNYQLAENKPIIKKATEEAERKSFTNV